MSIGDIIRELYHKTEELENEASRARQLAEALGVTKKEKAGLAPIDSPPEIGRPVVIITDKLKLYPMGEIGHYGGPWPRPWKEAVNIFNAVHHGEQAIFWFYERDIARALISFNFVA